MKCLVTGGAGFIGSHLQDQLIELGYDVLVLDNLRTGKKENLNPKAAFEQADITDRDRVSEIFAKFRPEAVFHLAAQNEVPYSMDHPFEDQHVNIVGTMNLLEASKTVGVSKFIYSNTGGAFYGDVSEDELPIKEDTQAKKPASFYGVSKHSAELYLRLYGNLYKIPWISLRYSNVYGPRQDGNKEAGVVAIFTTKLLNNEQPTIFGDGLHTRDYVFVDDVVDAKIKALSFGESDYFNISTAVQTSTNEVFEALEETLHTGIKPIHGPDRPGDARHNSLSPQKARQFLNWEPKIDFKTGIKLTVKFYQNSKN